MKKYILISKDNLKQTYTLCESDNFKFIYNKYKLWKNILPDTIGVYILSKIE